MTTTGQLGTPASRLGYIVLGAVLVPSVGGFPPKAVAAVTMAPKAVTATVLKPR